VFGSLVRSGAPDTSRSALANGKAEKFVVPPLGGAKFVVPPLGGAPPPKGGTTNLNEGPA